MKIIHIIPAAFDYFDDIRDRAMALAEIERELGHEVVAYTLQYGTVTIKQSEEAQRQAPHLGYSGLYKGEAIIDELNNFDVVHLHAPFLGLAKKFILWKKLHPKIPLVITYWRDIASSDIFSYFLIWYNGHYLPRLFAAAEVVASPSTEEFAKTRGRRWLKNPDKFVDMLETGRKLKNYDMHLTLRPDKIKLDRADMEALACVSVYNNLIKHS